MLRRESCCFARDDRVGVAHAAYIRCRTQVLATPTPQYETEGRHGSSCVDDATIGSFCIDVPLMVMYLNSKFFFCTAFVITQRRDTGPEHDMVLKYFHPGCVMRPSYGVARSRKMEFCAQHAPRPTMSCGACWAQNSAFREPATPKYGCLVHPGWLHLLATTLIDYVLRRELRTKLRLQ